MNNEMNNNNNNMNNTGNPSGMNFVQGGMPVGGAPVPPQQPVYQMPAQPPAAATPEMPTTGNTTVPITPQPVNPQPLGPAPVNFVASNTPTPSSTMPNSAPMNATSIPGNAPVPPAMPQPQQMGPIPGPMMPGSMPLQAAPMTTSPSDSGATPEGTKEKLPILMIIITVVVVLGVIVFLVMYLTGKINFGSKNNNAGTNVVENPTDEVVFADWMNYLLDQDTTEIKISRYVDADNTKSVNINKEQLKNIFTKMKDYNLVKYYSESKAVANDDLQISYTKNDVTYNFTLSGENINLGDDSDFVTLFTDENIAIEDDGVTSRDSENYTYILKNFDSSIYDDYFTQTEDEKTENEENTSE